MFLFQRPPGVMSVLDDICFQMHGQSEGADSKLLEVCVCVCVCVCVVCGCMCVWVSVFLASVWIVIKLYRNTSILIGNYIL